MKRVRQVALVARNLERALDDIQFVFDIAVSFRDPAVGTFGLHNAVMPIGETFLEVVSPLTEKCSAARYLDRRGGDGGYMVIVQGEDLAPLRERLERERIRIVFDHASGRMTTVHLHPRDTGGTLLSIDSATSPTEWDWAGPTWRSEVRTKRCARIAGVEIQCENPGEVVSRWARALGTAAADATAPWELDVGGSLIRFTELRDERGEGLHTILLACNDARAIEDAAAKRGCRHATGEIELAGVRFRLL
jgi:hypothetical protein